MAEHVPVRLCWFLALHGRRLVTPSLDLAGYFRDELVGGQIAATSKMGLVLDSWL